MWGGGGTGSGGGTAPGSAGATGGRSRSINVPKAQPSARQGRLETGDPARVAGPERFAITPPPGFAIPPPGFAIPAPAAPAPLQRQRAAMGAGVCRSPGWPSAHGELIPALHPRAFPPPACSEAQSRLSGTVSIPGFPRDFPNVGLRKGKCIFHREYKIRCQWFSA